MKIGNIEKPLSISLIIIVAILLFAILYLYYNTVILYHEYGIRHYWYCMEQDYRTLLDKIYDEKNIMPNSQEEFDILLWGEKITESSPERPMFRKIINNDNSYYYEISMCYGKRVNVIMRISVCMNINGKIIRDKSSSFYKKRYFLGYIPYLEKEEILNSFIEYYNIKYRN